MILFKFRAAGQQKDPAMLGVFGIGPMELVLLLGFLVVGVIVFGTVITIIFVVLNKNKDKDSK